MLWDIIPPAESQGEGIATRKRRHSAKTCPDPKAPRTNATATGGLEQVDAEDIGPDASYDTVDATPTTGDDQPTNANVTYRT